MKDQQNQNLSFWEDKQKRYTFTQTNKGKVKKKVKIRDEKGDVITDTTQRIIRNYCGKPYANKPENLKEIDKCLDSYNLRILNQ